MKKTEHMAKLISDKADKIIILITIPIAILFFSIVFLGVISRFVFKSPIIASDEISRIGFIWSCFLGAAIGMKREKHICFSSIIEGIPHKYRSLINFSTRCITLLFMAFLLYNGIILTKHVFPTVFPASGLSQVWMYSALPVTAFVMLIHTIYFIIRDFKTLHRKGIE